MKKLFFIPFIIIFALIVVGFFLNDEVKAVTTCGQAVSYGGQSYNTVQIGTQCWFKENLNVGNMIGNLETPDNAAPTLNDPSTVSKWCFNDSSASCTSEGGLYTWSEANGLANSCNSTSCNVPAPNQGICPTGWHIPTDTELYTLENYLTTPGQSCDPARADGGCSSAGTKLVYGGSSGFDAIGAGNHETTGATSFFDKRSPTIHFWSSSPCLNCSNWGHSFVRSLFTSDNMVYRGWTRNMQGMSVRCLADSFITTPSCTSWTYSDWSTCSTSGQQTRTVISSSPSGCSGGSPVLNQSCTYVPPTCSSWTYSGWSSCSSGGQQTRTVISSSPSGCTGGSPVLSQSCTPSTTTCTSWAYSSWSACSSSGQQTRTIASSSPSNCTGGSPVTTQSCTYTAPTCTSWTYSDWSSCSSGGTQTRNIISSSPSDCSGGNPILSQSCNYAPICTTNDWSCNSWSSCSTNGTQNRTCNKISNCEGGVSSPTTTQSCNYAPPCNSDTWECGSWNSCSSSGLQSRQCIITNDCQSTNTPSPNTTQSCQYVPSCKIDTWECGAWSSCSPNGIQARSCSKTYDCPSVENAPPETSQNCTPPYKPSTDTSSQQLTNQDSIIKSTVKLLCGNEHKWLGQGSGTVMGSNGLILTNKHVVDGSIGCLVVFVNNASDTPNFTNSSPVAGILKVSSYEDMAVLKIINYNVSSWIDVTKGNSSNLHLNDRVNIYGYPDEEYYGKTITSTSGDFSGYGTGVNKNYLKTTAMMDHGVSGGGTYLNNGTFLGMATGGYNTGVNRINYILSINTIKSWLTSNSIYANSVYSKSDYSENYSILTESNTNNIALLSIAKVNVLIYSNKLKSKILPHSTDIAQNNNKPVFVIQNLSNIEGYYVYFGDNITADVVKDGQFISKNEFSPETISTNGTYYFIFKAKDKQGILSDVNITPYVYGTINTTKSSGATVNSVVTEEKKLITKIDNNLSKRVSGNILLQVESKGEGWYVNPDNKKKYYLGRPADAFSIMKNLGLGIKHSELAGYLNTKFPSRLSGKILLDIEQNGEAYYVNPKNLKGYFLSRPSDAFKVMRDLGLGITNSDIRKIDVGEID